MAQNIANAELDALDIKILAALQKNCRLTLAELSEHVGLSQSPCMRRWRRLEEEGYITGYTALVDRRKLGRKMMAFVEIKLAIHSDEAIERFERAISEAPQVQECFLMTGQRDYYLRVLVDDLEEYDEFVKTVLRSVGNISSMETAFALREVEMRPRAFEPRPAPSARR
ncbi:Lrp/AsnC family transcriptional regulator [Dongia deserti]|uniref:Lrp/AsnC family transcriptional regulator n=1 Tax=Dongia deserti TaxID=2268030 RepID=UPI000E64ED95|nr:Lrp/AsnC family transcriptional regulator [Dongia deserti]